MLLALYYLQNLSMIGFNSVPEYCEVLKGFGFFLVIVKIEIREAFASSKKVCQQDKALRK